MSISTDIPILGAFMEAIGIEDFWFLLAIVFFIVCIVLAAALISSVSKRRSLQRELDEANEYATGLEALTHLPPIKYTETGELGGDSVVFASVREVKHMEKTGEIPVLRLDEEPQPQHAPAAVPVARPIVQPDPKPAAEPLTQETLASAIPQVRPAQQPLNVTAAVHDAILASVSGKHQSIRPAAEPEPEPADAGSAPAASEAAAHESDPKIRPLTADEQAQLEQAGAEPEDASAATNAAAESVSEETVASEPSADEPESSRSLSGKIPRL